MNPTSINQAWHNGIKCEQCSIRHLVLFADLQQEDFDQLHRPIHELEIAAGKNLYKENEQAQFVYTIRSGMIKLVRYLANGSYRIVRLLHVGDLAGIEALNGNTYLHHAVALQNTSVCRISIADIEQLNLRSPRLYRQLMSRWHNAYTDANIWIAELTVGNSRKRVANLLMHLSYVSPNNTFYLLAREDIGAILAITTETASRTIAEFKRLGYLKTDHNLAEINKTKLKQIC